MRKTKLILILLTVLVLIALVIYGFLQVRSIQNRLSSADEVIEKARQYETLSEAIVEERARCREFVAQREGEFGEFEYCKNFLDWSDNLN